MIALFTRWPIISFLLLGLLCFVASRQLFPEQPQIRITDAQFAWVVADWQNLHGSEPAAEQRQALIGTAIEEELLYQEALARGLQFSPAVQSRIDKLRQYLATAPQAPGWDEQNYLETDPLIRRYLIETLRQHLIDSTEVAAITEQQRKEYFERHIDRFETPAKYSFYHVFFSGLEQSTLQRATQVRARLQAQSMTPEAAVSLGDVFYGGHHVTLAREKFIQRQFGGDTGHEVAQLPLEQWSAPLRSAYGWHLVYVTGKTPKSAPDYTLVADRINAQLEDIARHEAYPQTLAKLREHYQITVALSD